MNRRSFLAGLGAAVATLAATTRLGETRLAIAPPPREMMSVTGLGFEPSQVWFFRGDKDQFVAVDHHVRGMMDLVSIDADGFTIAFDPGGNDYMSVACGEYDESGNLRVVHLESTAMGVQRHADESRLHGQADQGRRFWRWKRSERRQAEA